MFKIVKDEPDCFKDAKNKVKLPLISSAWNEIGNAEKSFKKRLIRHILRKEQNNVCAYCEKEIKYYGKVSGIDHFKKRDDCPKDVLNYNNLLVSCQAQGHCESFKDSQKSHTCADYDNIINPTIDNPNDFFEYGLAGDILIKENLNNIQKKKAEFTIKIFKLNAQSLIEARKRITPHLEKYAKQGFEMNDIFEYLSGYQSFIENIYPKLQQK